MINKLLKIFVTSALFAILICIGANAATSDEIYRMYFEDYAGKQYASFNEPYRADETDGMVNDSTASFVTNAHDYTIKGKNGFDVPFVRMFDTASSSLDIEYYMNSTEVSYPEYYTAKYICSYDNSTVYVKFYTRRDLADANISFKGIYYTNVSESLRQYRTIKNDSSSITYTRVTTEEPVLHYKKTEDRRTAVTCDETKFVPLQDTAKMAMPSFSFLDYESRGSNLYIYMIFQDKYGQATTLSFLMSTYQSPPSFVPANFHHVFHKKYAMTFVNNSDIYETATHPLGFVYTNTITDLEGETYYFMCSSPYNYTLKAISDRYGNTVTVQSSSTTYSEYLQYTTENGTKYKATSDGIVKIDGNTTTQLVSYDLQRVTKASDPNNIYTEDDNLIFTVKKNTSNENTIPADEVNTITYYCKQELRYDGNNGMMRGVKDLLYKLPYKVVYPNGLEMHIEYNYFSDWKIGLKFDYIGYYYYVSRTYEKYNNSLRNDYRYTVTNERTGSPKRSYINSLIKKLYSGDSVCNTETKSYDTNSRLLSEYKCMGNTNNIIPNLRRYYGYEYTYSSNEDDRRPVTAKEYQSKTNSNYTQYTSSITTTYTYNDTTPYPASEKTGNYSYTYTYYTDNYYLPKTVQYKQDANTTIKKSYTLTSDGKSIAKEDVYRNSVLMQTTEYTYDSYGNVASQTVKKGDDIVSQTMYNYAYNADDSYTLTTTVTGLKDADGVALADSITVSTYDNRDNLLSYQDANGNITTMTYDKLDRLISTTYADNTTESYSYDIQNNITTFTDKINTQYIAYFDGWGNKIKTISKRGIVETLFDEYTYNAYNKLSTYKRYYDEETYTKATYSYNKLLQPLYEKIYNSSNELIKQVSYTYDFEKDGNYRPLYTNTRTVSDGNNVNYEIISETSDYLHRILNKKQINPVDNTERVYTYTNDYVGNVLTETNPNNQTTTFEYDYANRLVKQTNADGSYTSCTYNPLGLIATGTDANGNTTNYEYDMGGRLIKTIAPFDGSNTSTIKTYYDANGNVTMTKTQNNSIGAEESYITVTNGYDNMNRLSYTVETPYSTPVYTQYFYTKLGKVRMVATGLSQLYETDEELADNEPYTYYTYNQFGMLSNADYADGSSEAFSYDNQGRHTGSISKNFDFRFYTYDDFDNLIKKRYGTTEQFTYDILGNRTSMTDSTGTTTYTYNGFGELTSEQKGTILKTYSYDNMGNVTAFTLKDGDETLLTQSYTYDNLNRLSTFTQGGDTVAYTYDNNSNLLTTTINGSLHETNQYNNANLPISKTNYVSANNPEVNTYSYYLNGNLATRTKDADAQGTDLSYAYTYNNGGQFIQETITGNNVNLQNSYIYDNYGNIKKETIRDINESNARYSINTYNSANQLVSRTIKNFGETINYTYTYDDAGNMLTESKDGVVQKTYTYDSFDRLATYTSGNTTAQYTYNGDNLRQSKTVNNVTTQHLYNGANIVADVCGDNTQLYIRGNSLHFNKTLGSTDKQTYMLTPKGDVSKLINADGTYEHFEYIPYGEISEGELQANNPFGYCGEYTDAESGLVYLRNRYYNPELGSFITEDPIKDGLNWYSYCSGNPINFVDPSGLIGILPNGEIYMDEGDTEIDKQLLQLKIEYEGTSNKINKDYIANTAKTIRENNPGKYKVLSTHPISDYYIPDLTDEIDSIIENNQENFVKHSRNFIWFALNVKTGALVDVKNSKSDIFGRPNYSYHIIVDNEVMRGDASGNILYGYLGTASNFTEKELLLFAGLYQVYEDKSNPLKLFDGDFGDNPGDGEQIKYGIEMYFRRNGYKLPIIGGRTL